MTIVSFLPYIAMGLGSLGILRAAGSSSQEESPLLVCSVVILLLGFISLFSPTI